MDLTNEQCLAERDRIMELLGYIGFDELTANEHQFVENCRYAKNLLPQDLERLRELKNKCL